MSAIVDAGPHDFSWAKVPGYLRFALGSVRRRWPTFLLVSVGMVALAFGALAVVPRTYEAECRLLVRTDAGAPFEPSEESTQTASLAIRRHDNLERLIRQTDLLAEWRRSQAPLRRVQSWIRGQLFAPASDAEELEALTALVERRLVVWTESGGAVTIRFRWPDPVVAQRLVDEALRGFIEAGYHSDVASLAETIPLLEERAEVLAKELEDRVAAVRRLEPRGAPPQPPLQRRAPAAPLPAGVENLRLLLEANRRALGDLEAFRNRTLSELQSRLVDQRSVLTDTHPSLVEMRRQAEALAADPPQVQALRQQGAELDRELAKYRVVEQAPPPSPAPPAGQWLPARSRALESATTAALMAARKYTGLLDQIATSRLRLEIAGAAFQRRHVIVIPPEVIPASVQPDPGPVMLSTAIDAILLGLFATTAVDLRRGRSGAPRAGGRSGRPGDRSEGPKS